MEYSKLWGINWLSPTNLLFEMKTQTCAFLMNNRACELWCFMMQWIRQWFSVIYCIYLSESLENRAPDKFSTDLGTQWISLKQYTHNKWKNYERCLEINVFDLQMIFSISTFQIVKWWFFSFAKHDTQGTRNLIKWLSLTIFHVVCFLPINILKY